jgi:hypothetical protein
MNPTTNSSSNDASSWTQKLMGKTIGSSHSETCFAKSDLPSNHRVLGEGDMATMDHKPDRLNLHVDKDGCVKKVTNG